ncbi:hypothetical protein AcW1_000078 [Taiwanofungus camphoratus]|nr:hypothetical protein AcW2_001430 [Antrodia cinnamomea]KAI0962809.1 hypothetical protein AcW1_000078 [Antrodia cinnamomea]
MNIPFAGAAAVFVLFLVKLPTPAGSLRSKLERVDWIGNTLVIGSTTAVVIGMTWGGVEYRWSSPQVLVPLCVGGVGLGVFLLYEALWASLCELASTSRTAQTFGGVRVLPLL